MRRGSKPAGSTSRHDSQVSVAITQVGGRQVAISSRGGSVRQFQSHRLLSQFLPAAWSRQLRTDVATGRGDRAELRPSFETGVLKPPPIAMRGKSLILETGKCSASRTRFIDHRFPDTFGFENEFNGFADRTVAATGARSVVCGLFHLRHSITHG